MITFLDLQENSEFCFAVDPKKEKYFFTKLDGSYAVVFGSEQDAKRFKNPTYVSMTTRIEFKGEKQCAH